MANQNVPEVEATGNPTIVDVTSLDHPPADCDDIDRASTPRPVEPVDRATTPRQTSRPVLVTQAAADMADPLMPDRYYILSPSNYTTTDGGLPPPTPGSTIATPTLTGGECPTELEGPPESLIDNEEPEWHGAGEIHFVCPDGDLLLHVRYQNPQDPASTVPGDPELSLRVSSALLRFVSTPLKRLLDAPVVSGGGVHAGGHVAIHEPRVWGCRESRGIVSLIVKAPGKSNDVIQAILIVFKILHHNERYLAAELPNMLQVALVAEVAWILDCVGSVVTWIQAWLTRKPKLDADGRLVSGLFLGRVLQDRDAFAISAVHWIQRAEKSDVDKFLDSSLGLMYVIHDDLERDRHELAQRLVAVVNKSLLEYCRRASRNIHDIFILGAAVQALFKTSGLTIAPYSPVLGTSAIPHFHLAPQATMNEQSIQSLMNKLLAMMEHFERQWDQYCRSQPKNWNLREHTNPVIAFGSQIVKERQKLSCESQLEMHQADRDSNRLMDVNAALGYVRENTDNDLVSLQTFIGKLEADYNRHRLDSEARRAYEISMDASSATRRIAGVLICTSFNIFARYHHKVVGKTAFADFWICSCFLLAVWARESWRKYKRDETLSAPTMAKPEAQENPPKTLPGFSTLFDLFMGFCEVGAIVVQVLIFWRCLVF